MLFIIHRLAGFVAMVTALMWLVAYRSARQSFVNGARRKPFVRFYQLCLALLAVLVSQCAWIGRALDGRWVELVSPLPVYNFVSRPDVPMAHVLVSTHVTAANILLVAVSIHAMFAVTHWLSGRHGR